MQKDEIITLIERLVEDAGLELENDSGDKKLDRLIKNIANAILELQDDADASADEILEVIVEVLPKNLRDDDDWYSMLEEVSAEVLPLIETNGAEPEEDEDDD